jgi:hypothetical protein
MKLYMIPHMASNGNVWTSHNTPIPNIPLDVTCLAGQVPRHFFR